MNTNHAWYIRHKGNVEGPFPAGQIKQELLLGRYKPDDEVSHDKDAQAKVKAIENSSEILVRHLIENVPDEVILSVLSDHTTSSPRRTPGTSLASIS